MGSHIPDRRPHCCLGAHTPSAVTVKCPVPAGVQGASQFVSVSSQRLPAFSPPPDLPPVHSCHPYAASFESNGYSKLRSCHSLEPLLSLLRFCFLEIAVSLAQTLPRLFPRLDFCGQEEVVTPGTRRIVPPFAQGQRETHARHRGKHGCGVTSLV